MQSGRSERLFESDSADHDLGLHDERSTCFRDDAGLSFCLERRCVCYDRGFPFRLGASELFERGRRNSHHSLDVHINRDDIDTCLCLNI